MSVTLGYACISIVGRKNGIYTGRTAMLKTVEKQGVDLLISLARANAADLAALIEFNEARSYRFFRISSDIFPHITNPRAPSYSITCAADELAEAGGLARSYGHRITMHPGQFVQLGSPRPEVVKQSIAELNHHADILTAMGLTTQHGSVIIVHAGGVFGDKAAALDRWRQTYRRLPESTRQFIVLENDDYHYNVKELLPLCEELHIPLCVDFFHHACYGAAEFDIYDPVLIERVMSTWRGRGIKPKCHWSAQAPGARLGSHSDYIENIPAQLLKIAAQYDCDIMCECKMKDECMAALLEKYFDKKIAAGGLYYELRAEYH